MRSVVVVVAGWNATARRRRKTRELGRDLYTWAYAWGKAKADTKDGLKLCVSGAVWRDCARDTLHFAMFVAWKVLVQSCEIFSSARGDF